MGKRGIVLALLIVLFCMPLFASSDRYDGVVAEIAENFASVIGKDNAVAFVAFDCESKGFTERFRSDLERNLINRDVTVVDRSNIDAIVAELEFQTSGLVDDDSAVSIGHMLGAKMIISAKAANMIGAYRVDIQLIDIESTQVKRHLIYYLKYDTNLRNIINGNSSSIGNQKFGVGVRGGMAFEFNKAHEDMVGEGLRPAEKSPKSIVPTLAAFYRVLDTLKVQLEVSFIPSNGIDIIDMEYEDEESHKFDWDISIKYSTVDIPVIVAWNFIQEPVSVDVFAGAYVSIPVSSVNMKLHEKNYDIKEEAAVNSTGIVFGAVGGFDAGFKLGPGSLVVDARFFYDLVPSKAKGDILGDDPQGLLYRKGLTISAGYMFEI